jgi:hypothetical protein
MNDFPAMRASLRIVEDQVENDYIPLTGMSTPDYILGCVACFGEHGMRCNSAAVPPL